MAIEATTTKLNDQISNTEDKSKLETQQDISFSIKGQVGQGSPNTISEHPSTRSLTGKKLSREIVTNSITIPVVNTTTYFYKNSSELIDSKEKRIVCQEYTRYMEVQLIRFVLNCSFYALLISALEGAESTLVMASGMCASTVMLFAMVPKGGHIATTKDCYKETRMFTETFLPKMGITVTLIDSTDIAGLQTIVNNHEVFMFFTESPTNSFLRCVDIKLVSEICHKRGTLVCIDGTIATPLNQKALALGADLVIQSATKYIGGHNDLVSEIRIMHNLLGGTLNPNAAYLLIRGIKTMHLRVKQQNSTALRMANVLEAHPKIDGDLETTIKFIDSLKIPYIATSFGGCEKERLKYGLKDNLVRFSFGVEDFEDLKADILQALNTIPTKISSFPHQNGAVSEKN
ncbi:hypothetical protein Bca4012_012050 [Brassica carinata]|uniref:Uncharacterized protein n=1 Tax=Brassica carinata TaxID=52824 RepID=A0A8X7SAE2_BRACI|nr:hypothetical protein Bca52824_036901 [Brassica carinata]